MVNPCYTNQHTHTQDKWQDEPEPISLFNSYNMGKTEEEKKREKKQIIIGCQEISIASVIPVLLRTSFRERASESGERAVGWSLDRTMFRFVGFPFI